MPNVEIPFAHGQSEGIDQKMLPQGLYKSVINMRYRKDARLVSRFGYDYVSTWAAAATSTVLGSAKFGPNKSLHILTGSNSGGSAPVGYQHNEDGTYSGAGAAITELGGVTRIESGRNVTGDVGHTDCGYCNGYIFTAVAIVGDTRRIIVTATDRAGSAYPMTQVIPTAMSPRVCVLGTTVAVFFFNTSSGKIGCALFTCTSAPAFSSTTANVATPAAGFETDFAACPGEAGKFGFVYHTGTNLSVGRTTTTNPVTYTAVNTIAIGGNSAIPDVGYDGATTYRVVWTDGISVNAQSYTSSALIGTPDIIETNGGGTDSLHMPTIAFVAALSRFVCCWQRIVSTGTYAGSYFFGNDGLTALFPQYITGFVPVSRPFSIGYITYAWAASVGSTAAAGALVQSDYALVQVNQGGDLTSHLTGNGVSLQGRAGAVACQREAVSATQIGATAGGYTKADRDVRRTVTAVPAITTDSPYPGAASFYCALPVVTASGVGCDIVKLDYGRLGAASASMAFANGRLVIAGPRVSEFDGSMVFESGMRFGPEQVILTAQTNVGGNGLVSGSTYLYVAVFEWFDALGCRHRSPPSFPLTVAMSGGNNTATVNVSVLPFTERTGGYTATYPAPSGAYVTLYRTKASGTVFYLVAKLTDPTVVTRGPAKSTDRMSTIVDGLSDTDLGINEVLYTQGGRGGLSGLLPNDEPPPCRYVWAGINRVIMGGLENPLDVAFSKLFFPGEPVQYSIDAAFRVRMSAEVTSVFSLDNTFYACTRGGLWSITGAGPDDSGGGGEFGDPVKLPSDVGVLSHRSVVEVPQGILFQATTDRIYLLPRGGNSPQWIGQAIRDTLAAYPYITSATMNQEENCAYFSCVTADGATGVMLVYDTRIGEWYVDNYYTRAMTTLCMHNGKLLIDANIAQTSAWTDDDTGAKSTAITQTVELGDVRAFGPLGWGRYRKVTVMGEYRDKAALTLGLTYNSGVSYANSTTFDMTSGLSAGGRYEREYMVPVPRGAALGVKLTIVPSTSVGVAAPSEGLTLTSLVLQVFPEEGTPRLADSARA